MGWSLSATVYVRVTTSHSVSFISFYLPARTKNKTKKESLEQPVPRKIREKEEKEEEAVPCATAWAHTRKEESGVPRSE